MPFTVSRQHLDLLAPLTFSLWPPNPPRHHQPGHQGWSPSGWAQGQDHCHFTNRKDGSAVQHNVIPWRQRTSTSLLQLVSRWTQREAVRVGWEAQSMSWPWLLAWFSATQPHSRDGLSSIRQVSLREYKHGGAPCLGQKYHSRDSPTFPASCVAPIEGNTYSPAQDFIHRRKFTL